MSGYPVNQGETSLYIGLLTQASIGLILDKEIGQLAYRMPNPVLYTSQQHIRSISSQGRVLPRRRADLDGQFDGEEFATCRYKGDIQLRQDYSTASRHQEYRPRLEGMKRGLDRLRCGQRI